MTMNGRTLTSEALDAWRQTVFGASAPKQVEALLANAYEIDLAPGDQVYRADREPHRVFGLVVHGLLRVYTKSSHGRQATVRYLSTGQFYGLVSIVAPGLVAQRGEIAVEALSKGRALLLSSADFMAAVDRDARLAHLVYRELVGCLLDAYEMLATNVFLPVRRRVSRHLLEMAVGVDRRLVVHVSQQNVADAIGSVREVVSRAMLQLRDEGLIARIDDGYEVLDAAALHRVATADT